MTGVMVENRNYREKSNEKIKLITHTCLLQQKFRFAAMLWSLELTLGIPGATVLFLHYLNNPFKQKSTIWQVATQTARVQHLFHLNSASFQLKTTTNLSHEANINLMMFHHGAIQKLLHEMCQSRNLWLMLIWQIWLALLDAEKHVCKLANKSF